MHLELAFSCLFPGATMAALPVRWDYFRSFSEVDEIKTSVQTSVRARFNKILLLLFYDFFKINWCSKPLSYFKVISFLFLTEQMVVSGIIVVKHECSVSCAGRTLAAIVLNTMDNIGPIFHEDATFDYQCHFSIHKLSKIQVYFHVS